MLSIVPPAEAIALAERLATAITARGTTPIVVDCNAVNVATIETVAAIIKPSGARFVDGGIIGLPPKPGTRGPRFYVCGEHASELAPLRELGLDLRIVEGPIGAASALKMSYAGVNKGLTALGTAMALAAMRAGAASAMCAELAESQPQILARLAVALPDMIPKAYRWVAEMREIAGFLGPDDPANLIFEGAARLFEHIAAQAGNRRQGHRSHHGLCRDGQATRQGLTARRVATGNCRMGLDDALAQRWCAALKCMERVGYGDQRPWIAWTESTIPPPA